MKRGRRPAAGKGRGRGRGRGSQQSMVIGEEGRSSSFKFLLIQNLKLLLFPH
jgi:hypothetical protein